MNKVMIIIMLLAMELSACVDHPKINIYFELTKKTNDINLLSVNFKNNSDVNLMVLSMGKVKKVGVTHPCGDVKLDNYTKISSHEKGDCNVNIGSQLFVYKKIEPFNKLDYLSLKKQLINLPWFKDRDELFDYMDPSNIDGYKFPSFVLIEAGKTATVEYIIDGNLSEVDTGKYIVYWASKEETDNILSPKNSNMYKLRDAISNLKKYKLYDGLIKTEPLIFKL
jgi:hypothetical protein